MGEIELRETGEVQNRGGNRSPEAPEGQPKTAHPVIAITKNAFPDAAVKPRRPIQRDRSAERERQKRIAIDCIAGGMSEIGEEARERKNKN